MKYRVFYNYANLPPGHEQTDFLKMTPYAYDTKELAMEAAFNLLEKRVVVWGIYGPNQFQMMRGDIEKAYWLKTGKWPQE